MFLKENAVPTLERWASNQGIGVERYELTIAFTGLQEEGCTHQKRKDCSGFQSDENGWVTSKHGQTLPQGEHRVGAVSKMGSFVALCQGCAAASLVEARTKTDAVRELGRLRCRASPEDK